jgi:mannose-6-phosphate isomerase-like protein (cupin superfamily)
MPSPVVNIGCVKNLFVRQLHFKSAGDQEEGTPHAFDTFFLLAKGRLAVEIGDEITEFTAPQIIYIKASVKHELKALTDGTVMYCIYALRESSGDIISLDMTPKAHEMYKLVGRLVDKL